MKIKQIDEQDIKNILTKILTWGIGGILIISGIILTFLKFLIEIKINPPWCVILITILISSGCLIYLIDGFINNRYRKQIKNGNCCKGVIKNGK